MAEVVRALEGDIAPIECITAGSDGALVCVREGEPGTSLPHQAALDPRAGLDRPHAHRHDAGRPGAPRRSPNETETVTA